jgi:hypothetical protein
VQCRLCHQNRPLRNSHVLPEFLYAALYDEKHRYLAVSLAEDTPTVIHQKGLREKLLCGDCEQLLGRYERYASQLLYHKPVSTWKQDQRLIAVDDVDYVQFKLFLLSLLWRAGVSKLPEFNAVELGAHESIIRELLLNDDPGPATLYACLISVFSLHQSLMQRTMVPFIRIRTRGLRGYRAVFGGFLWHFIVASVGHQLPAAQLSLHATGRLVVHVLTPEAADRLVREWAAAIPDEADV